MLVILFFILKKQRKLTGLLFIIALGVGAWQGWKEYNRTNEDMAQLEADIKIAATALIHDYETNDTLSNQKYLGKVIEVNGPIKKIEKNDDGGYVVVLGDTASLSAVRCAIDSIHSPDAAVLQTGTSAILRGNCSGFNKDELGLGSDVILNRCAIIKNEK